MGEKLNFEIELKSLLSEDQYKKLLEELPKKFKLVNEDTIHTTRFRPNDIRLRHSSKIIELIYKEGDPTKFNRKEITIPLKTKEDLDNMHNLLLELNFKADPSWIKHKKEFVYSLNGFDYIICLQHIEKFAYILEVEHMTKEDNVKLHESNIKNIITELGCEPINPEEFNNKIKEYIENN